MWWACFPYPACESRLILYRDQPKLTHHAHHARRRRPASAPKSEPRGLRFGARYGSRRRRCRAYFSARAESTNLVDLRATSSEAHTALDGGFAQVGRSDVVFAELLGRPRLAQRLQHAPRVTEMLLLLPDEKLWADPNRRFVVLKLGMTNSSNDSGLEILHQQRIDKNAARILFACDPGKASGRTK